jgi:hypothetical protein
LATLGHRVSRAIQAQLVQQVHREQLALKVQPLLCQVLQDLLVLQGLLEQQALRVFRASKVILVHKVPKVILGILALKVSKVFRGQLDQLDLQAQLVQKVTQAIQDPLAQLALKVFKASKVILVLLVLQDQLELQGLGLLPLELLVRFFQRSTAQITTLNGLVGHQREQQAQGQLGLVI